MAKKKGRKAEPKTDEKQKAKDKQAKKVAQAVWKATEAHKSTIGKLAALVDTWDEYDAKAEDLKEQIAGLKGMISEDKAEIRRLARIVNTKDHPDVEKDLKSMAGLERDTERREVKLAGLVEERGGAREAIKCAMADIRKIIKDGPGLFDDKKEPEAKTAPRSAEEVGAEVQQAAKKNGTRPRSNSTASPAECPTRELVDEETGKVIAA